MSWRYMIMSLQESWLEMSLEAEGRYFACSVHLSSGQVLESVRKGEAEEADEEYAPPEPPSPLL